MTHGRQAMTQGQRSFRDSGEQPGCFAQAGQTFRRLTRADQCAAQCNAGQNSPSSGGELAAQQRDCQGRLAAGDQRLRPFQRRHRRGWHYSAGVR